VRWVVGGDQWVRSASWRLRRRDTSPTENRAFARRIRSYYSL
jgi:hypothetical protein